MSDLFLPLVACSVFLLFSTLLLGMISLKLSWIERNTRPPKPDIKSFITKNTKGDQ